MSDTLPTIDEIRQQLFDMHYQRNGTPAFPPYIDELESFITRLIAQSNLDLLKRLEGWVDTIHAQPEDFGDRWSLAGMEIRNHITAERERIEKELKS